METPPAVPPKDGPSRSGIALHDQSSAPPSSSKRKRQTRNDLDSMQDVSDDLDDLDEQTPKRSRVYHHHPSDAEASVENTPAHGKGLLRRKQKIGNLSNLNLRHKAKQQQQQQVSKTDGPEARDSKFQEGSFSDKPSVKPPSAFTRMIRTDSGNLTQLDQLMAQYHAEIDTRFSLARQQLDRDKARFNQLAEEKAAEAARNSENGGIFRFGRRFVPNIGFNPVDLWKQVWNDTKDDLTRKNLDEMERQARLKLEAEAKYALMKARGQFNLQQVAVVEREPSPIEEQATPRDSGVDFVDTQESEKQQRYLSTGTVVVHPVQSTEYTYDSVSGSEVPDSTTKSARSFLSRLYLKRPSMSNLKRVKSDINISASSNRDSSLSVSPLKSEVNSTLRKSVSKIDLKKQHKLSKRVSDLELRLQQARQELDDALVDASPVPQLNSKYQRFIPSGTIRRPKFMPGKLPTLSSQMVFDPAQLASEDDSHEQVVPTSETRTHHALDLSTAFDGNEDGEDTIKASVQKQYPTRASTLFNMDNTDIMESDKENETQADSPESNKIMDEDISSDREASTPLADTMETLNENVSLEPGDVTSYDTLDAKLRALDAQVKSSNKLKSKKRKSGDKDGVFRPDGNHDDEDELDDAAGDKGVAKRKKSKKRKTVGKNEDKPDTKRVKSAKNTQISSKGKKSTKVVSTTVSQTTANGEVEASKQVTVAVETVSDNDVDMAEADTVVNSHLDVPSGRLSLDSQALSLEPVYEEEEELADAPKLSLTTVTPQGSLSLPPAHASPARHSRDFVGARPGSPKKHRSTTSATDDMSGLRGKENGVANGREKKEDFAWPEDVF